MTGHRYDPNTNLRKDSMKKTIKSRKTVRDITWTDYTDGTTVAEVRGATRTKLVKIAKREGIPPDKLLLKMFEDHFVAKGCLSEATTYKEVTFVVPAHIADLIDVTRDLMDEEWERWGTNPFFQSFEGSSGDFDRCVRQFCDLMFYDGKVSSTRLRKLLPHLRKAYNRETALRKAVKP